MSWLWLVTNGAAIRPRLAAVYNLSIFVETPAGSTTILSMSRKPTPKIVLLRRSLLEDIREQQKHYQLKHLHLTLWLCLLRIPIVDCKKKSKHIDLGVHT